MEQVTKGLFGVAQIREIFVEFMPFLLRTAAAVLRTSRTLGGGLRQEDEDVLRPQPVLEIS